MRIVLNGVKIISYFVKSRKKVMDISALLTFLYTTSVGNRLLRILVSPAVSKAAGCVMNSRLSLIAVSGFIKSQNIDVSEFEKTSSSATAAVFFPHTVLLIRCQCAGTGCKISIP